MRTTGSTILGTAGIGRALAEAFHARGNRVAVAGRRQALLREVTASNPGTAGLRLDLNQLPGFDGAPRRGGAHAIRRGASPSATTATTKSSR